MTMLYLDYAGSGLFSPDILARYSQYCGDCSINPHGGTRQAEACRRRIKLAARRLLAAMDIPEDEAEVIWTSGGTESLNLAIFGAVPRLAAPWLVDAASHHAMLLPARKRAETNHEPLVELPPDSSGLLSLPEQPSAFGALCVCQLNNETGAMQPLRPLRDRLGPAPLLIVDACQSFGKRPLEWSSARVDMLAVSSRKIGGPATGGALILRKGLELRPMMFGGGQQNGYRPGTLDTASILAFADAAENISPAALQIHNRALGNLMEHLLHGLGLRNLPTHTVISRPETCHPGIVMLSFPGYEGAVIKRILADSHSIIIGTGSACSAESGEPSHVLTAMGYPADIIRGAIRLSFSPAETTISHIDVFLDALQDVLKHY